MPELEPITREEKFLNGEVGMTPITREEKILAGEDIETVTRREYFLKKYRGGGGGDVTVVPLSVTENGTYSEEGKAYSPVSVNIPLPSNAYLLKSVANLPQAIATFKDGADAPMKSLKVAIEPQQDLHGYDAPWVGGAGKNKFDVDLPHQSVSGSLTYTYNLTLKPNTTYTMSSNVPQDSPASLYFNGGTTYINGVWNGAPRTFTSDENGNLVAYVRYDDTQGGIDLYTAVKNGQYYIQLEEGSTATTFAPYSNICPISGWSEANVTVADDVETPTVSNVYTIDLNGTRYGGEVDVVNGIVTPAPYYASYNGEALTGEWISDRDEYEVGTTPTIGAQVVNIGASGTPVSILPTAVKSLSGVNNVWADTGDITDAEYFSKEV